MRCPTLGRVPRDEDLTIKASTSGITVLKQNRFLRRYTGNKNNAVDINGGLWLSAAELEREKKQSREEFKIRQAGGDWAVHCYRIKKAQVETQAGGNKLNALKIRKQKYDTLSTQEPPPPEDSNNISPKKAREYTVHKREVRQRLLGFINTQAGKKELYFWTITFPPAVSDDLAYRVFNSWLTSLRQHKILRAYLWVAERQKVGTVHFHMAVPHRMDVKKANGMMRGTLKTMVKKGLLNWSVYQCNRYNGVDIAKNRKTKKVTNFAVKKGSQSLITYLTKYVTKNDTAFQHLAWHNSREFSSLFTGVTFTLPEFETYGWPSLLNEWKAFENDFFIFIPWHDKPPDLLVDHLFQLNSYLQIQLN
jgi:hypothetical protein